MCDKLYTLTNGEMIITLYIAHTIANCIFFYSYRFVAIIVSNFGFLFFVLVGIAVACMSLNIFGVR